MPRYQLAFRLAGFPVAIHVSFFILAVLLGIRLNDIRFILVWVGVLFVSVLAHEMGHALMGRRFGMHPEILLYAMGGLTSWRTGRRLTNGQSILVSFAGPAVGLIIGTLFWALGTVDLSQLNMLGRFAIAQTVFVNIVWSLVNLLPILPLDGGNIMRSAVRVVRGFPDERLPRQISIVTAVIGGLFALSSGSTMAALMAAYFAYYNYAHLRGAAPDMFGGR